MYLNVSHVSRWWSLGGFPNTATLETSWRCHCTQRDWPLGRGGQTCCHLEPDETVNDSMMPRMPPMVGFIFGCSIFTRRWILKQTLETEDEMSACFISQALPSSKPKQVCTFHFECRNRILEITNQNPFALDLLAFSLLSGTGCSRSAAGD